MALADLRAYAPDLAAPDDLTSFWDGTIANAREAAGPPTVRRIDGPLRELVVEDLEFSGFAGDPIRAWITRPHGDTPRPAVVEFVGYGGGRGLPSERLAWAAAGYVHVVMDTRGQGSDWGTGGETPDPHGAGAAVQGFMTRGIERPEDYYYRRVFTDGVRLVDTVRGLDAVDASRVAVTGGSQGGGIAIAVAALSDGVAALMPDVPFLCDFPRAIARTGERPFAEVTRYLSVHRDAVDRVLRTLSYFDGAILARSVEVPALFSVGLMDEIVLPSTVFAAFNALASQDRSIEVYAYNGHEGGLAHHWLRQAEWLAERFND